MHWCYTAVVQPILIYGALVWWTAASKISYRKPLGQIQRLAVIWIMGALKVPLHQKGYSTYHQLTLQRKVSSGLVDKLDHILVSSRFIWKVNRKFSDHLQHLYRRIKLANGVRAGIYCSEPDLMQLPEYCSIFQAQVCVVRKSAEIANNAGNNIKNTDICVRR